MTSDLKDFFSLIGKAKKEKEDEFQSLVGDLDIDSMFNQVKVSVAEEKKKKEKEERQVKALESWLFAEPKEEEEVIIEKKQDDYEELKKEIGSKKKPSKPAVEEIKEEEIEEEIEEDTIDHALKILDTIKSKEEVREQTDDPEILKIRRELEYLKNLVNMQGGGGEVRLEFLDDIDRDTALVNGKYLQYNSSTKKFVGADASGGGGGGDSDYASVAGIATFATTAGVSTNSTKLNDQVASYYLDYDNFTNTPTIPTNNNQLTNGAEFITASDNITGTSAGLSGSPDIGVQNIVGVAATFTGDLTIEGTLSYEDITNIDSVGFATFRKGIEVQGAGSTTTTLNVTGVSTFSGDVNFAGDINGNVTIVSTDTGSSAAPELTLYRNSASPAPGDYLGQIMFKGENSNGGQENYAKITGKITDETLGTEDGLIETAIKGNGSFTVVSRQRSDELQLINGCGLSVDGDISGDLTGNVTGDVNAGIVTSSTVVLTNGLITTVSSTTTATNQTSIDSFSASTYRSAKYNVQITRGSEYQTTEISVVHDGSDSYGTEYATIKTGATLATFSTDISGGNVRLLATPSSATSTVFKLFRTATEV